MKRAADDAGRDGDAIPIYAMAAGGQPGDALDARIEALADARRDADDPAHLLARQLAGIGQELVARFG